MQPTLEELLPLMQGDPSPGARYQHYRTGHDYTIVCRSIRESNLVPLVTYAGDSGVHWTRTVADFSGQVEWFGEMVPRFTRVED